jgi:hypothetical protein
LKAAGVSDLSQHIEGIDPVDDGRAESGLTQPHTVFQLHVEGGIEQEDVNAEYYSDLRELASDFLGLDAVNELLPLIETSNRFAPLSETNDSELNTATTPDSVRSKRVIKKKPHCNLGFYDKAKKKHELAKKRVFQKAAEKSRRTLFPTEEFGGREEHSSDDEEEETIQTRRVERKGKKGKKVENPLSINNLLNSRRAFYHEDFPHLNKDTRIIDLSAAEIGVLVGLRQTPEEYPISYVPMIRAAHMSTLRKMLMCEDDEDTNFKKWLLLDRIVMTAVHDKSLTKLHRLELIKEDNWDYFTLGLFKWKDIHTGHPNLSTPTGTVNPTPIAQEKRQKLCNKQLDRGGIRKAMNCLLSTDSQVTDHTEAFQVLTDQHVQLEGEDANLTRAILQLDSAPITSMDVGGVIRKTSTTTAPDDVTGTRARYVKQLISDGTPDAERYL